MPTLDPRHKKSIEIISQKDFKTLARHLRALTGYVVGGLHLPYCYFKAKKLAQCSNLDKLINFTFQDCGRLLKPLQIPSEMRALLGILNNIKPKFILEIGTAGGGCLFLFSRVASQEATLISIDLPGGGFGDGSYPRWKIPLYKSFASANQQLYLIKSNSHHYTTLEKVKSILKSNKVDFLFIDGDHSYQGVKQDYEMYSPLVKKGGLIAFHDIKIHLPQTRCRVSNFWHEIKAGLPQFKINDFASARQEEIPKFQEIIEDPSQNWGGIGILRK